MNNEQMLAFIFKNRYDHSAKQTSKLNHQERTKQTNEYNSHSTSVLETVFSFEMTVVGKITKQTAKAKLTEYEKGSRCYFGFRICNQMYRHVRCLSMNYNDHIWKVKVRKHTDYCCYSFFSYCFCYCLDYYIMQLLVGHMC